LQAVIAPLQPVYFGLMGQPLFHLNMKTRQEGTKVYDYTDRVHRLQHKMHEHGLDAFIITQIIDIYYFTGTMQSGYLVIPSAGEPVFFVRKSYARAVQEYGGRVVPLDTLKIFKESIAAFFPHIFQKEAPVFATEYDVLPLLHFKRLETALPGVQWADGSTLIRETRMIKSPDEINKIKQSAQVIDVAIQKGLRQLQEGMSELEFISILELQIRKMGHSGILRFRSYNHQLSSGIVISGKSASVPTYFDGPAGGEGLGASFPIGSGWRKIERNVPILIDVGCTIDGYSIDQSRTVVIGDLPEELKAAYDVSERVMKRTESSLKPGTACRQLYCDALEEVSQAGLIDHFMGYKEDRAKFLGHGIGLEIDEFPVLSHRSPYSLEAGMVIAVEPKFTFPGQGVVGIEDTYVITESGFEKLSITQSGLITL
jgi:Xaa-Pro aminopeptidase